MEAGPFSSSDLGQLGTCRPLQNGPRLCTVRDLYTHLRGLLPLKMSIASMFTKEAGKRSRDDWEEVEDVEELKSVIEAKEVAFCIIVT